MICEKQTIFSLMYSSYDIIINEFGYNIVFTNILGYQSHETLKVRLLQED